MKQRRTIVYSRAVARADSRKSFVFTTNLRQHADCRGANATRRARSGDNTERGRGIDPPKAGTLAATGHGCLSRLADPEPRWTTFRVRQSSGSGLAFSILRLGFERWRARYALKRKHRSHQGYDRAWRRVSQ
jgi:hypothetical protein